MQVYYFTEKGYEKLRKEIDALEKYLKNEIASEIGKAREHGDLRENAEYEAAKNKQANTMVKLGSLQERFQNARVIRKEDLPADIVTLGKTIDIEKVANGDKVTYSILGDGETDIDKGIISYQSPLAKGLMKHKEGDVVTVQLPRGSEQFKILKIAFYEDEN
ncbi:MAG: transcription elongation factor GreA [Deferribacteres bacterium]|nr:transcription elongation factor GreA [candidate division KSB1 bacterium]MCB9503002.1 transcription elongation factor GreA [Deferribacteres bacterium]